MTSEDYKTYEKIIYSRAWYFQSQNPSVDVEELISEGNLSYAMAQEKFNHEAGVKFSTYLQTCVDTNILFYLTRGRSRASASLYRSSGRSNWAACVPISDYEVEDRSFLTDLCTDLSDGAKKMVKLVIDTPQELIDFAKGATKLDSNVIKDFAEKNIPECMGIFKKNGQRYKKVDQVFGEIQAFLS